ncbi:reverse transcriptase-like protein [Candidatus Kaiserbacteria bacterium]|nr:reverse transcriptase-like protein [Candidatus Kaiserbacteria bacterium]
MKKLTIYTHGESQGNPGPAAIGVWVVDKKGAVVLELAETIGNATKDYAEYFAVVRALQELRENLGDQSVTMQCELRVDNKVLKQQLNAEHEVKDVSVVGHFVEIYNLRVVHFPNLLPIYINKDENKIAIKLAKTALII